MNNDPLLNTSYGQPFPNDANSTININERLEELYRRKKAFEEKANQPMAMPQQKNTIFDDIEGEFEGLTDEQKMLIYSDEEYQKAELKFTQLLQAEIIAFIRPRLLNNKDAMELLESQKETIRVLKRKINSENEKKLEEFKDYTEKHSHMTFAEYKEMVNGKKVKK